MSLGALTVLSQTLILAAPRELPALTKRALGKLTQLAKAAQAAQVNRQRGRGRPFEDKRLVDVRADRAVSFVYQRLGHYALLAPDEFPLAPRAAELGPLLFPDGLDIISLPYVEQLAAMEVLVTCIDKEGLDDDLQKMCGPDLVANLRTSVARYRDMVQDSLQKADETENLQAYRRTLSAAIVNYATKVAALYDEDDAASLTHIRTALRPIDVMRAQINQRSSGDDSAPAEPSPPDPESAPADSDPPAPDKT